MKTSYKKGFTLVELIIVITILSILAIIGLLSFNGYASNSRDSKRLSDIGNIKTGLEIFYSKAGKYPIPKQQSKIVTYSGAVIFYEGVFGLEISRLISINKVVKDPLYEDRYYTYSVVDGGKQYQLGYITENVYSFFPPIVEATYADSLMSKIVGNYSGSVLVSTGGINISYIAPSIITSNNSTGFLDVLSLSGNFVKDGDLIMPFSYGIMGSDSLSGEENQLQSDTGSQVTITFTGVTQSEIIDCTLCLVP